ncbi:CCE_0567 family metalloprotein [Vibrio porteresiae]|uniref:CCE_0567 family metalloprotein n=1 Tax=Vibrio porteresiae DSM 19223 TaxID=1123496 RepID=A0ABZ0QA95_9VIBR|nr:CCE_0567 family metalloprotein [Vibrio porteresiae]WPC72712.1 CCE_0567 family metalloprotein [Vibrio porteresiae DSM 19223]
MLEPTTEQEKQELTQALKRAKRIASERAGELHDLVEERLPEHYEEIPILAKACYEACLEWAKLKEQLAKQV